MNNHPKQYSPVSSFPLSPNGFVQRFPLKSQTYLAKDAEKSDPQDKQDGVPGGDEQAPGLKDERDKVEGTRRGRQGADDDGIHLR